MLLPYDRLIGQHKKNDSLYGLIAVAQTRFGRLVVQGGLTTGLLHALVAMELPGPGTVFLSQEGKFTAPVFIGDTITHPLSIAIAQSLLESFSNSEWPKTSPLRPDITPR